MRTRDKRNAVRLSARMRSERGWADVRIHNVSSRGMLLSADEPPDPGGYLEVRRGPVAIVARIVWRSDGRFGVRTQDRIDLKALIAASRARVDPDTAGHGERRTTARHDTADRSRHVGRMVQYGFLLTAIIVGAIAVGGSVMGMLAPLRAVEASLVQS